MISGVSPIYTTGPTRVAPASAKASGHTPLHLLIPASEKNSGLCKTLLSASLLNYPTPTLINFNKTFDGDGPGKGSHTGKIRGIHDYLAYDTKLKPDDTVLIVDGYDVWFQLPPEVLLRRYRQMLERSNDRLMKEFGAAREHPSPQARTLKTPAMLQLRVVFGADKECCPNPRDDHACASVPASTLPAKAWGAVTDTDPDGFSNRPKYLNSGAIIGSVSDVKALYQHAIFIAETQMEGDLGDQFVLAKIFGEQEHQRNLIRQATTRGTAAHRWREWITHTIASLPNRTNRSMVEDDDVPTPSSIEDDEFGVGLDYEMELFQTMTHSHYDVDFLRLNNSAGLQTAIKEKGIVVDRLLNFREILEAPPPLPEMRQDDTRESDGSSLDTLPAQLTWLDVPLAINLHVPSVPALLHFNGDKSYLDTWWPRMWYHAYSRALLRRRTLSPPTSSPVWSDDRGGAGGFWTDGGQWLSWREICGGFENAVFGDGRGEWGKEEGAEGKKVYNEWGELVEDDELGV